jgi:hypothetical protein
MKGVVFSAVGDCVRKSETLGPSLSMGTASRRQPDEPDGMACVVSTSTEPRCWGCYVWLRDRSVLAGAERTVAERFVGRLLAATQVVRLGLLGLELQISTKR